MKKIVITSIACVVVVSLLACGFLCVKNTKTNKVPKVYFTRDISPRGLLKIYEKVNKDISVFEGRVVSGDQFISGREKKDMIKEEFDGLCTEMEGASIAHVSYLNNVPFLIIRAISDKADDSANEDYPSFQKKAIRHSVDLVKEMIKNM